MNQGNYTSKSSYVRAIVYLFTNITKMENRIDYIVYQFLLDLGIPENISSQFQFLLEVLLLVFLCFIADRLAKNIFVRIINSIVKKTKFLWDDVLLENKVFDRLAHLAPALVVQATASYVFADFQDFIPFLIRITDAYMLAVTLMVVISVFNTLDYYFKQTEH